MPPCFTKVDLQKFCSTTGCSCDSTTSYLTKQVRSRLTHNKQSFYFKFVDQGSQRPDQTVSLSDTEDLMRDGDLTEVKDEALCHEMSLADR